MDYAALTRALRDARYSARVLQADVYRYRAGGDERGAAHVEQLLARAQLAVRNLEALLSAEGL